MYKLKQYLFKKGYEKAEKRYGGDPATYFYDVANDEVRTAKQSNGITVVEHSIDMIFTRIGIIMLAVSTSYFNGANEWLNDNKDTILSVLNPSLTADDEKVLLGILDGKNKGFEYVIIPHTDSLGTMIVYDGNKYTPKEAVRYWKEK